MSRNRLLRSIFLSAGLALVSYVLIGLYPPSPRSMILGINRSTGEVRTVRQHVTFLPPFRYYRLKLQKRGGWAQYDGMIRVNSREGVPVTVSFRLRFGVSGDRIHDAHRLIREGWDRWIQARVGESVSTAASLVAVDDVLSPTSHFNASRDELRRAVAGHLAENGLTVTAFEIAGLDVDRQALLRVKQAALRRDVRSAPARVAIFALDGAGWDLLSQLSGEGRMPNIRSLIRGGTTASLQTIQPAVTPMLWTTVATGLPPDRHGVLEFTDRRHHSPVVESYARRTPALWDIAGSFGRRGLVTSWWTAWPPAPGTTIVYGEPVAMVPKAIDPPALATHVHAMEVQPSTVNFPRVRRFLNIQPAEWDRATSTGNESDPIRIFRDVLAKTWNDHDVTINIYAEERQHGRDPMLIMMYGDGTDTVNHLFGPYRPPFRDGVSQEDYRKFSPAVASYYSEIDRLIGEWMNALPRDTTIIVLSAYGFPWGKQRPKSPPGGTALVDHRNPGIFIAYGPHVAPSRAGHTMSLYDVAPAVLTLLGLPKSNEMPGETPPWMFRDISPITSVPIESYGDFLTRRPITTPAHLDAKIYRRNLEAIGHIYDVSKALTPVESAEEPAPPARSEDNQGMYAYFNNLGVELRGKNQLAAAVEAFQRAIEVDPDRPAPYFNLAITRFDLGQYDRADLSFLQATARGLPDAEAYVVDFAALYRQHDLAPHAIVLLSKGKEMFPRSYLIAANLGSALLAASRSAEGVRELERALSLGPSSPEVLNNLGIYYARREDYERALVYWNRSLAIEPHQPGIRQAAAAARFRL